MILDGATSDNNDKQYTRVFIKDRNVTIFSSWANLMDHNAITGNSYGIYLKGGYLPNGTLYPVWANVTGNNTIANNTQYGVYVDGPTVDPTANHFWMWWNDVRGNGEGVHVEGDTSSWGSNVYFRAYCNWWNDASGPFDNTTADVGPPDYNPNPPGQSVSDYLWYRHQQPPPTGPQLWWLRAESQNATECAPP